MIRRDYVLRMIEEFIRALTSIRALKREQRWEEARQELEAAIKNLVGAPDATQLSESELRTRLLQAGPSQGFRDRVLLATTLLREAGDIAVANGHPEEGQTQYLKALHLLLDAPDENESRELPEFVPKVDQLVAALDGVALPLGTHALLMRHYEATGQFAKAEDALGRMLDAEPGNVRLIEFGNAFYRRLLAQSDAALTAGNLPRGEVEEGMRRLTAD
jgi:tetratricopeptide (TPR) repeat protein